MTHPNIRILVKFLRTHPLVQSAKLSFRFIEVKFKTGIKEKWRFRGNKGARYLYDIDPENLSNGFLLRIAPNFQTFELDDNYKLKDLGFHVSFKEYAKAGELQQRMFVQTILLNIMEWKNPEFSEEVLQTDILRINEKFVQKKFRYKNGYRAVAFPSVAGRKTLMHFMPWGLLDKPIKENWEPLIVYRIVREIIKQKKDICLFSILAKMRKFGLGPRFINPNLYRTIARDLKIKDVTIADVYPGCGSKLLAFCLEDCTYHYGNTQFGENYERLAKFIGSKARHVDERKNFDLAILDKDTLTPVPFEDIGLWNEKADSLIVFSNYRDKDKIAAIIDADKIVEIYITGFMHHYWVIRT